MAFEVFPDLVMTVQKPKVERYFGFQSFSKKKKKTPGQGLLIFFSHFRILSQKHNK